MIAAHRVGKKGFCTDKNIEFVLRMYQTKRLRFEYDEFFIPKYHWTASNKPGYQNTETLNEFGDPSTWEDEWHTMSVSDCLSKP